MSERSSRHTTDESPSPTGTVTLRMVAQAAGVSVSTASRALNGQARRYRISPATEQSVQKAASELGFQASQVARSLRLRRSGLIGVVVPDISNPFFAAIAREVALGVESEGYSVVLGDSREATRIEQRLASELRSRQIEGLLVCPVGIDAEHLVELDRAGLPVVVVDRAFDRQPLHAVTSDNQSAAREVVQVLLDAGHRRIGVLSGMPGSLPTRQRLRGYRHALKAAGVDPDPGWVSGDAFDEASGYQATRHLLENHKELTALFAMCTPSAIGALRALDELSLGVPQDISIVSFDDEPYGALMKTPLTTVVQDVGSLGRTATKLLMTRLRNAADSTDDDAARDRAPTTLQVPTRLVHRASVGPPPHR